MASSTNEVKAKFTADTKGFDAAIKQANSTLTQLRSELRLNKTEAEACGNSVDNFGDRMEILNNELTAQQDKIDALTQKLGKAKEAFGDGHIEVQKLETQLNNAKTAYTKIAQEIDRTEDAQIDWQNSMTQSSSALGKLESELNRQESALSKLKSQYNEVAASQGEASDEARQLASQISKASAEVAQSRADFQQASSAADKFDKTLEEAADSADELGDSLDTVDVAIGNFAADLAGQAFDALTGLEADTREYRMEQGKLAAQMVNTGKATIDQVDNVGLLSDSFIDFYRLTGDETLSSTAASNLNAMGLSVKDTNTLLQAGSGMWAQYGDSIPLDGLMESINESSKLGATLTGPVTDAINWAKMSQDQWSESLSGNVKAQQAFNKAMESGMTSEDAFNEALAACSTEQERQQLIIGALSGAYGDLGGTYNEITRDSQNANQAQLEMKDSMAQIGEAIAPATTQLQYFASDVLEGIASNLPTIVPLLGGFAAGLGAIAAVKGIQSVVSSIQGLAQGAGLLKSVLTALGGPVGIVVGLIAVLAGAFIAAYNSNEEFRNGVNEVWNGLVAFFQPIIEQIVTLFQTYWPIIQQTVQNVMTQIQNAIQIAWPIIQQIFQTASQVIQQIIQIAWPVISTIIQGVMNTIQQVISFAWPLIQQIFSAGQAVIQTLVQTVWPVIQSVIQTAMSVIQTVISVAWPIIQAIFQTAMSVIQPLVEGAFNAIQTVISTVMGVVQGIISTIMNVIEGDWEGAWNSIKNVASTIWNGLQSLVENAINTIFNVISSILSSIKSIWSSAWDNVKSVLSKAWDGIKNAVQSGIDGVLNFMRNLPGNIVSAVGNLGSLLSSAGRDLINGLKKGITGAIDGVVNAVKGGVNRVINAAKGLLGIASPSKVFAEIGMFTMEGMSIGIKDNTSDVINQVQSSMKSAIHSADSVMQNADLSYQLGTSIEAKSDMTGLVSAIQDLADRVISIEIDGKQLARATASSTDRVNGSRQQLVRRGVALA